MYTIRTKRWKRGIRCNTGNNNHQRIEHMYSVVETVKKMAALSFCRMY